MLIRLTASRPTPAAATIASLPSLLALLFSQQGFVETRLINVDLIRSDFIERGILPASRFVFGSFCCKAFAAFAGDSFSLLLFTQQTLTQQSLTLNAFTFESFGVQPNSLRFHSNAIAFCLRARPLAFGALQRFTVLSFTLAFPVEPLLPLEFLLLAILFFTEQTLAVNAISLEPLPFDSLPLDSVGFETRAIPFQSNPLAISFCVRGVPFGLRLSLAISFELFLSLNLQLRLLALKSFSQFLLARQTVSFHFDARDPFARV